jgi:predicted dehydrogenase
VAMAPVRVGLVGCGTISGIYLQNARRFESFEVVACADVIAERAQARATEYGVPRACSVDELLADPSVEVVLNLTIPRAHGEVGLAALAANKSVYNEKPLAIRPADAQRMLALAAERGLRVGGAPDTFLGGGLQSCRHYLDQGLIGAPVAAVAFFLNHGHEHWHPDPDFYYQAGAGPLFDMGPYYLTALVSLIGPIRRVTSLARASFVERTVTSQPKYGTRIQVNTPTHVAGLLDFAAGAVGTIITSFDVWPTELPRIEIYGTEGSLSVPDPNTFGGPVRLRRPGAKEWEDLPLTHGYLENSRGLGLADLAYALRSGREHRASAALTYHVLDAMQSLLDASVAGRHLDLASTCARPAPLPTGLAPFTLDP